MNQILLGGGRKENGPIHLLKNETTKQNQFNKTRLNLFSPGRNAKQKWPKSLNDYIGKISFRRF